MLEHYVVFRPRPGREGDLEQALTRLADGLGGPAAGVTGLSELTWGRNTNRSGLARGFTHGCLSRFSQPEAFQAYWDHAAHQELLHSLDDICEDRFALDYTTGQQA